MTAFIGRREFITLLGGAAAWPVAARAQQPDRIPRIGVLMGVVESLPVYRANLGALREGLQALGWTDGRNVRIDTRWAAPGNVEALQLGAKELVAIQPDLILSHTTPTTATLLQQTRSIPITLRDKVNEEINAALADPKIKARLDELGSVPMPMSPANLAGYCRCSRLDLALFCRTGRANQCPKLGENGLNADTPQRPNLTRLRHGRLRTFAAQKHCSFFAKA
jgi:hypothetical protein